MLPVQTKQILNVVESKNARSKVMLHCVAVSTPQQRWFTDLLPRYLLVTRVRAAVWSEL